jgi:opacity protein-like surface antigen
MRKFLISAALAASTFVAAAPAAAQYYPPQPQGYGYGYNNYGQVRRLQVRVDNVQRHINRLDSRDVLSEREAKSLRAESRNVENRLHRAARYGLSGWERNDIERRISRLEYRVQREARDGNRYGYYQTGYGQGGWNDHDRDGLDDRYERDHGSNYDEDHDRD